MSFCDDKIIVKYNSVFPLRSSIDVLFCGDSIIKHIDLFQFRNAKTALISYRGAGVSELRELLEDSSQSQSIILPSACKCVLLHVGVNDIYQSPSEVSLSSVVNEFKSLISFFHTTYPSAKISLSLMLPFRPKLEESRTLRYKINDSLRDFSKKFTWVNIIEHESFEVFGAANVKFIGQDGIHPTWAGTAELENNFRKGIHALSKHAVSDKFDSAPNIVQNDLVESGSGYYVKMSKPKVIQIQPLEKQKISKDSYTTSAKQPKEESSESETESNDGSSVSSLSDFDLDDSIANGHYILHKMISPVSEEAFFEQIWEKKALLIRRKSGKDNALTDWFSTEEFDTILRQDRLEYGVNIDLTTYVDYVRNDHNLEGRVNASTVWEKYNEGCSVRLINPQTYSVNVWNYLSLLQEVFNSFVGANVYLTPPNSQGFAPHYDDIEAFMLQLEGRKHWKVYAPRNKSETLPVYSSENFCGAENTGILGTPVIDTILEAGDIMYVPRGFIHHATTLSPDEIGDVFK